VFHQFGNILWARSQRGDLDGNNVEPVEKVAAEGPCGDLFPQVAVGQGEKSDVQTPCLGTANPGDLPVLDGAQQLGLEIQGEVADLIQQQGAAVRQFKEAGLTAGAGAGEGALIIAEQL
jgi:hypothetical protein